MGILLTLFCCVCFSTYAQKSSKIEIVNANSLEFDKKKGSDAKRLIGNVIFKQDNVFMYCDSAYFYSSSNKIIAYSNIKINQEDSLQLFGDSLKYFGENKFAEIIGHVVLLSNNIELKTNKLHYNRTTNVIKYFTKGVIKNKKDNSVLTSERGSFYQKSNSFLFYDSVRVIHPDYVISADSLKYNTQTNITYFIGPTHIIDKESVIYCERGFYDKTNNRSNFVKNVSIQNKNQLIIGDSIYYDKELQIAKCFGNVAIIDTVEKTTVKSDYTYINQKDSSSLSTGHLELIRVFDTDTFYLHADTLLSNLDSLKNNIMRAFHKVKFFKNDLQGSCDSLIFAEADSAIKLFNNPILWSDANQMTADYIKIMRYDNQIKSIDLLNNAFMVSQFDSVSFNQISGKNMKGIMVENKLKKLKVFNNGETIYFPEEDSIAIGMNKTICNNMDIYLLKKTVEKIVFFTQPSATLYPIKEVTPSINKLKGFKWLIEKRPKKKEDIFKWE